MGILIIETKEDSPVKLAAVAGKDTKYFLFAGEFNAVVAKLNELNSHIIPFGEMLVFQVEDNQDSKIKAPGDFCMGIVEGFLITGNYLGGNDALLTSYDIATRV
jgi:hypothetical protein